MAAIELGASYYVYNPTSSQYFCLNNPSDPKFVGYINEITGLDSAGIRENAQPLAAASGGYHGPFWADRRPWTISGFIMPTTPLTARSAAVDLIQGIMMQCLQADGYLTWIPSDGIQKTLPFRNQQPFRDTKGQSNVERNFLLTGVTSDWRIFSEATSSVNSAGATGGGPAILFPTMNNAGNADSPFELTLFGPINGFTIVNNTTGKNFVFNKVVSPGQEVIVDLFGTYPTVSLNGLDASGYVSPTATDWSIAVAPGDNNIEIVDNAIGGSTAANNTTVAQFVWYSGAWA